MSTQVGVLEWFHFEDREHVERVVERLRTLKVRNLRTGLSWADWFREGGPEWFDWLIPRLAEHAELLPCLVYTPPSLGVEPRTASPPRDPKAFADFVDLVIERYGEHFEWVELWNEPNNRAEWDWTLDPEYRIFADMVAKASWWAKKRGKKTLLGGISPIDPTWLSHLGKMGGLNNFDAFGVHGFPGTWEVNWDGWRRELAGVQKALHEQGLPDRIWITETGYSTWSHNGLGQLRAFLDIVDEGVERAYWYSLEDLHPHRAATGGYHEDEREYHFGLVRNDGSEKFLARLWADLGVDRIGEARWLTRQPHLMDEPVIVTGGAGFVGVNLVDRLLREGEEVLIIDSLERKGSYENISWLRQVHGDKAQVRVLDVRDHNRLRLAIESAKQVYHLAAQVAVTSSLTRPVFDFESNARGTLNLLEVLRAMDEPPPLVFTSTNKVYGALEHVPMVERATRHEPLDDRLRDRGVAEDTPLDLHSPYGCSKGAADQYVRDYARAYGLPNLVFRMSCIYGPHQHGNEDQGWVAHFMLQGKRDQPVTVYGDGKQVRDVLYVDDLVDALRRGAQDAKRLAGRVFNIGGGPGNTLSLVELLDHLDRRVGYAPEVRTAEPRVGDQLWYVSDTRAFQDATGWRPEVGTAEGLRRLQRWVEHGETWPQAHSVARTGRRGGRS